MNYSHTELTSAIIEAAMEVQRAMGGGFSKVVIGRALAAELNREGIDAEVDAVVPLFYKGAEVGQRRIDISVEGLVAVELDTVVPYQVPDLDGAMRQLRASGMDAGLLLNFGPGRLDYVRLHVQGCRSDILIGDSVQQTSEGKNSFGLNGWAHRQGAMIRGRMGPGQRWLPLWLRGRRLQ